MTMNVFVLIKWRNTNYDDFDVFGSLEAAQKSTGWDLPWEKTQSGWEQSPSEDEKYEIEERLVQNP